MKQLLFILLILIPQVSWAGSNPNELRSPDQISVPDTPETAKYFQKIKDTITKKVYRQYAKAEEGQVAILVRLSSKGQILDVTINSAETTGGPYLQNMVIKSVKSFRKFPSFPKDLRSFSELNIRLVIDFKIARKGP